MIRKKWARGLLLLSASLPIALTFHTTNPVLQSGVLVKSEVYRTGQYLVNTDSLGDQPYLTIHSDNIEIDFNHATIDARMDGRLPDRYKGIGIHIKNCKNITLKNVSIHGFKIAILAENVENLTILSANLSYNYRPKLRSRWDREALSDWLYFHNNENDEWKSFGAAIYLRQCRNALVKDVLCHQGMNGLLMVRCENSLVYNNDIRFNSGLGIGLYRSGHNRIMHNKLDWNARGYSHGKYARGQDSAAILLYEQSSHNVIAYNSATHSGDGLFLWAGQHTMDTGQGGCDSNIIYRNDFSHSIANGIEVTFSANYMIENLLNDSRYGVWGGYSHHSVIRGNQIIGCETGIAIEHGRYIIIEDNQILDNTTGIQLWARKTQPADWMYAQKTNVASRQYYLANNHFKNVNTGIEISLTDSLQLHNNSFTEVIQETSFPNGPIASLQGDEQSHWRNMMIDLPSPVPDGDSVELPPGKLRGRKYIIVNEWGPYSFQYPLLTLRQKEEVSGNEVLHFDVLGPQGTWRIDSIAGCSFPQHRTGTVPDSFSVICPSGHLRRHLALSFTGDAIVTQFGDSIPEKSTYLFSYAEFLPKTAWTISFFAFDSLSDPLDFPAAFRESLNKNPLHTISSAQLGYRWWGAPDKAVPADRFAVKASTSLYTPAGEYTLQVESDDGIRVWLDHELLLERWDIHTPTIDEIKFHATEGQHNLQVEYFEATGLAVLDVSILDK